MRIGVGGVEEKWVDGWVLEVRRGLTWTCAAREDVDELATDSAALFGGRGDDRPAFVGAGVVDRPLQGWR